MSRETDPEKPWTWQQDVKNPLQESWRAAIPGTGLTMVVWGIMLGSWTWEVWCSESSNPDKPDFSGPASTYDDAVEAAERCLKENSWG